MTQAVSTRDGVGSGLTVMCMFGVFWGILGVSGLDVPTGPRVVLILVVVAVGWALLRAARLSRAAHAADAPEPARSPRSRQIFLWVNVGQATLITASAFALGVTRHPALIPPVICLIVGLHFFPLAHGFGVPLYWLTGAALCLLAVAGGVMAFAGGPRSQVPFLVVGFPAAAILWATSLVLARRGR
jgi:hypothetical protein